MPLDQIKPFEVYIGLGSNLGDREANIRRGLEELGSKETIVTVSDLIETDPVGGPPGQGPYLNGAACIRTALGPRPFLQTLLEVEKALGRVRTPGVRDEPRSLDLDLLLYGDGVIEEKDLAVPHPRLHERDFVLRPLAQIAPHLRHPVFGETVLELLARLSLPHSSFS